MYSERLVECADCGDRFKITYDSRKEKQDEYKCKCGKLVCYPDYFGGYSYNRSGSYNKIPYEEQECRSEYYEEDYIKLTEEETDLLEEIDTIGNALNESSYGTYTNLSEDDSIYLHLDGCNKLNEGLTISFETRLQSFGNGWSEREARKAW